jgi:glycosyltransferase involved in cell wall biosynthesis
MEKKLFYAGQRGGVHGWGICNQNLIEELSKITSVVPLTPAHALWNSQALPGDLFTPLANQEFVPVAPARGVRNFAYTFFEFNLSQRSVENAARYEIVFAGSTWCAEQMKAKGITNGVVLVQGVDGRVFAPRPRRRTNGRFQIFSGGKLELRKGQDLVLRAFKVLHQKYPDIDLVTAWFNQWQPLMAEMAQAPGVRYEQVQGSWTEQMEHFYRINGIDPRRVITVPMAAQTHMAEVYRESDIGVFPNRCEGGTNLVLMEYMASGRPVIVSNGTGHRDVVNAANALLLNQLRPMNIVGSKQQLVASWVEPSLDEIIAHIEFAYHHRERAAALGRQAAVDMQGWTWERAARTIVVHTG